MFSRVGGGLSNTNLATSGTIAGGEFNSIPATGYQATVAGGSHNTANGVVSGIGGGSLNQTEGDASVVGGGWNNNAGGEPSTIGGGLNNQTTLIANDATIGGGNGNLASAAHSTVAGGIFNRATSGESTVGGGNTNVASGFTSTVSGGAFNVAGSSYSTIPGGSQAKTISYGQQAYASGRFANPGDAQGSLYVSRNVTQNAIPTALFLDGVGAQMVVPAKGTWTFQTLVVARDNAAWNYSSAGWRIEGVVEAYSNANGDNLIQVLCQTVTPLCSDVSGWTVTVGVWGGGSSSSPHGLSIMVTGSTSSANPVRWVATTRTAEVSNP